eukprot:5413029-Amphidinium_carterae.1
MSSSDCCLCVETLETALATLFTREHEADASFEQAQQEEADTVQKTSRPWAHAPALLFSKLSSRHGLLIWHKVCLPMRHATIRKPF